MHYFKKNIGDYHKKAGRLSMLQHGAYTLLIDSCYDREKFPTLDEAIDWAWASSKDEVEAVEFVLKKFFTLEDGVFVQDRIREEIEKYHSNAKNNKRIAIEREAKRKEKRTKRANESTERARQEDEAPPNQEPLTINQEPITNSSKTLVPSADETTPAKPKVNADVLEVFEHWKQVMGKSNAAKLTKERKAKVTARFKDGYTVDQIKQAIDGCAATDHNMGRTPESNGKRFDDLELICRTGSHVERFAGNLYQQQSPMQGLSRITQQNIKNLEGDW